MEIRRKNNEPIYLCFPARKGGVGKTMFAANTAGFLANDGYRVLVVGTDSQEDLSTRFLSGTDTFDPTEHPSLYDVLDGTIEPEDAIVSTQFYKGYNYQKGKITGNIGRKSAKRVYSFDILPAGKNIDARSGDDLTILKDKLKKLHGRYDFIIFDTPPSESEAVMFVMMSCDYAIVPVSATDTSDVSSDSINGVLENIELANENGSQIKCLGVVVNNQHANRKLDKYNESFFKNMDEELMFSSVISASANIPNANAYAVPLCSFDSTANWASGTADFYLFYEEMMEKLQKAERDRYGA